MTEPPTTSREKESVLRQHLPLKANWFHILLSLAECRRHGYAVMQEVLERTDGEVRLWPATLYGSMRQLQEAGLIEECEDAAAQENDDPRRRYFRISALGRDLLEAEAERLRSLAEMVRSRNLGSQARS
ncbi:MAG TPA: PadR family transcriptional regulator [Acidobacteriota bacterium]|nr:PadR family transcriptional regulator [Acidobacteriota bacterium]